MQNDIDLSNDALLKHRAIAEKATPGPWEPTCRKKVPLVRDSAGDDVCRMLWHKPTDTAAHIAANSPEVVKAHIDEILRLRAEVERLEREADWLAAKCQAVCELSPCRPCSDCCPISPSCDDYPFLAKYQHMRDGTPYQCWREAARKAVEETA